MTKRDMALALLVVIAWGVHFPVIKIGTNEIPGALLVTIRFFLTGLVFLPFCKKLTSHQMKQVLIFSVYYYMSHLPLLFIALRYLDSATVALIMQIQVPFAIIIGWLLHKENFGWKTTLGLALAFAGVFFIFGSPDITSYLGLGLTVCSALFWAFGSIHMRNIKDVDMPSMTAYSSLMAVPATLLMSFVFEYNQIEALQSANWLHLGAVLFYQVFLMSLMMYFWKQLMSRNSIQVVTSFSLLQPAVAVVAAHYMLGEVLSTSALIGGGLAMLGVGVIIIRKIQKLDFKALRSFIYSE